MGQNGAWVCIGIAITNVRIEEGGAHEEVSFLLAGNFFVSPCNQG